MLNVPPYGEKALLMLTKINFYRVGIIICILRGFGNLNSTYFGNFGTAKVAVQTLAAAGEWTAAGEWIAVEWTLQLWQLLESEWLPENELLENECCRSSPENMFDYTLPFLQ